MQVRFGESGFSQEGAEYKKICRRWPEKTQEISFVLLKLDLRVNSGAVQKLLPLLTKTSAACT